MKSPHTMDDAKMILDLLDQPHSEVAWDAFVDALGQMPDDAAQALLPEMQARLAAWPDHLRVASKDWATRGDLIRLAVCRVAPLTPLLSLRDIFNQELEAFNEAQENDENPPRLEDAELEIGDAYFLSSQKRVLGLCYDHAGGKLYAFESAMYDPPKESFRSYDHLYRINYHTGECLRMHSFKWEKSYQRMVCLLLEALSPNRVLLVVSKERYEWTGMRACLFLKAEKRCSSTIGKGRGSFRGKPCNASRTPCFGFRMTGKPCGAATTKRILYAWNWNF